MHCPACNCPIVQRAHRRGFLQTRLYPLLGFYPWQCQKCSRAFLMRDRGDEEGLPTVKEKPG